jgi:hypothetical protein
MFCAAAFYLKTTVIPQPPYPPCLTPSDVFLFLKIKWDLKGQCFENIEQIQAASQQDMMKMLTENYFHQCF